MQISAVSLEDEDSGFHRMLKLRDPWGKTQWEGKGKENDKAFWEKISNSQ